MRHVPLLLVILLALPVSACATEKDTHKPEPTPTGKGSSSQASDNDLRPRVIALLSTDSVAPEQWQALGPGALLVLRQLVSDPAEQTTLRLRAVEDMAFVDNPQTSEVLRGFATDANVISPLRKSAVMALSARDGTTATPVLSGLLGDNDADVRVGAARALGNVGGSDARTALQARLDNETDPKVREEIQKSLARVTN